MKKNENRIAIYSRKSKFTGKGESIGNQVELCKEYIRTHYNESALESLSIYEDEGFSGGNLERPAFKQMMKAARDRAFRAIIVYRLDRISRNISDFSGLIEELSRLDIAFISIKEQFDTGTPMGRAMMYIASVFSQLERETIAERIRDNMHELAKTGRWLGGNTPTGYTSEHTQNIALDGKVKKACKLKLIPHEAQQVRLIFELFLQTGSLTATEAELMHRCIKTKNGKPYTRFSLRAILQNPVYLIADNAAYTYFTQQNAEIFSPFEAFDGVHGILAYNRTDQNKGPSTIYLPIQEWIISVGQHSGLIPSHVWLNAQQLLERNRSKSYQTPRSNQALLTGLLFCSCGSRMYPKLSSRKTSDGKRIFSYLCKLKETSHKSLCNSPNLNGNLLDVSVFEQLYQLIPDTRHFITELHTIKKNFTSNQSEQESEHSAYKTEQLEIEKKITSLVDSLAALQDTTARHHVARRIEELHQLHQTLQQRIDTFALAATEQPENSAEIKHLLDLSGSFPNSLASMTTEQKRATLRNLVDKILWDGKDIHVFLLGYEKDHFVPSAYEHAAIPESLI